MKEEALKIAELIDAYRMIPRLLILLYGWICWEVTQWFMALPGPTGSQAALVSTVWGAAAAWFGAYAATGRKWDKP